MVDRVKRGEPLYGVTELSDYMQGVAARNSRYTGVFFHVMPMFNFVNHNQVSLEVYGEVVHTNSICSTVLTLQNITNKQSEN